MNLIKKKLLVGLAAAFVTVGLNSVIAQCTPSFVPNDYGAADANELAAFDAINLFRADPQNELYEIFQGFGYSGTKAMFDSALQAQTTYPGGSFWSTLPGVTANLATNSMDFFMTVPATLEAQFAALPAAGTLAAYSWSDNIGWAAHQYSNWVEMDAGATSNPHAVAGAPGLGARFTNAGVNWTNVGENIAADWPLNVLWMHSGFAIDWGTGVDGIQSPPGHRNSMLSTTFTHAGIGILDAGWTIGDVTQVQHFAAQSSTDDIFYGFVSDCMSAIVAGALVEVFDAAGNSLGTATTDAKGAYTIQFSGGTPAYAEYTNMGTTVTSDIALGSSGSNYFLDAVVPEPSGGMLFGWIGLIACLAIRRKKAR